MVQRTGFLAVVLEQQWPAVVRAVSEIFPANSKNGLLSQDDRYFAICFGPLRLGVLDDYTHKVLETPSKVLPMFPVYLLPV